MSKDPVILPEQEKQIASIRRIARLLDSAIPIPGTNRRIGLDGLLGLVPGVGDSIGALVSISLIYWAASMGAPAHTVIRMLGNVLLESVVGVVPIFGDLFDFVFKANEKNVRLLEEALSKPHRTPRSARDTRMLLAGIAIAGVALIAFSVAVAITLLVKLLS